MGATEIDHAFGLLKFRALSQRASKICDKPPPPGQAAQDHQDLTTWLEDTKKNHPAIVAAMAQVEAARKKVDSARADGLPTVDLVVNAYQNGYPGQGVSQTQTRVETVGLTVTVPLFEGFATTYKIRSAQAQAEQSVAQLADTENQTLMEVVKAYADATSSLQNLSYSATLLNAAQEALATSQRRYDKGAADIMEMLTTQTAFADAAQERIRTLAEWRSARLRLLAGSGVLGRDRIESVEQGKVIAQ
ncbi:TolC family protein [Methylomonas sp. AM2-LC]|uniref:TolC family protein n=1 Tax=Methylomonas sp. AM2-LC TaxID=3153301 RepID=UPI003267B60F